MPEVPATRTPASMAEIAAALDAQGERPRNKRALLLAQISLETANGQSMVQHNVGNLAVPQSAQSGATTFWRPPWFAPPTEATSERNRELHQLMLDGKEPSAFRAFSSLGDGVAAGLLQQQDEVDECEPEPAVGFRREQRDDTHIDELFPQTGHAPGLVRPRDRPGRRPRRPRRRGRDGARRGAGRRPGGRARALTGGGRPALGRRPRARTRPGGGDGRRRPRPPSSP